ncbi:MAG: AraC family transcriptional regulator, partial [Lachnospiraceae bacterium]|nr:AraC family transcriptional regulator [Lachnospiraceae bacterium]
MNAFHEIVVPSDNFPAVVIIHTPENTTVSAPHWHESIELIASLDSRLHITCGQNGIELKENEIALINSAMIHGVVPVKGHAVVSLSLRLDPGLFRNYSKETYNWFDLNRNKEVSQDIACCCRKLYELYAQEEEKPGLLLEANSLVFHIVYLMITYLCISRTKRLQSHSEKYYERYCELMAYIEEHYNEPLTLNEIAGKMHLSKEHLSREFRSYVGEGFREHLTNIRLIKAQKDLLGTDLPLIDIAIRNGFPNLRAYN